MMAPVASCSAGPDASGIPATGLGSEPLRSIAEQLSDPAVLIEYRPGACAVQAHEIFGGPDRAELGPHPADVIRGACRALQVEPVRLLCDPDPRNPNGCYLADQMGVPLCRITGMTSNQANDAIVGLCAQGWAPGLREYVTAFRRSALDGPAPAPEPRRTASQGRLL